MINYKLIGIKLGDGLKYSTSINEINRIASAIFNFNVLSHPQESITSSRSQLIYDWIMTLSEQHLDEKEKLELLNHFINAMTPESDPMRNLPKEFDRFQQQELNVWIMIHRDIHASSVNRSFID